MSRPGKEVALTPSSHLEEVPPKKEGVQLLEEKGRDARGKNTLEMTAVRSLTVLSTEHIPATRTENVVKVFTFWLGRQTQKFLKAEK